MHFHTGKLKVGREGTVSLYSFGFRRGGGSRLGYVAGGLQVWAAWVGTRSSLGCCTRSVEPVLSSIQPNRFSGAFPYGPRGHVFLVEGQLPYRLVLEDALSTQK